MRIAVFVEFFPPSLKSDRRIYEESFVLTSICFALLLVSLS